MSAADRLIVAAAAGPDEDIRWSDGDVTEVAPDDDDLGEFAGCLEIVAGLVSDEPLIIGGP